MDLKVSNKRKPIISIIISSDNDCERLKKCINSFLSLDKKIKNVEFVIINNYSRNRILMQSIQDYVSTLTKYNIVYYQTQQRLTTSQIKNLALDFQRGYWLFFVDYYEIATPKFIEFLKKFKFDIYTDFYRLPILDEERKKIKMGFLWKSRFFSTAPSTIIFNQEYIEKYNIRWENEINYEDTLIVLSKIYSTKNVNYVNLPKQYSVIRSFYSYKKDHIFSSFKEIYKIYEVLMDNKEKNYKQFIILLFFNYFTEIQNTKEYKQICIDIKHIMKKSKIYHYHYFFLGFRLYFKTFTFRWKMTL